MHPVSAPELLDIWEWGLARNPIERGLALLAAAWPGQPVEELARLPVGWRDIQLLNLRESLFGPKLEMQTACPQCAEPLELQVHTGDLVAAAQQHLPPTQAPSGELLVGERVFHFRLPDSLDLLEAAEAANPRQVLLKRCLVSSNDPDETGSDSPDIPAEAEAALMAQMQSLNPLSAASFSLTCPVCAYNWTAPFDILGYFWSEIDAWAYRTLREVHWLASTYHWREDDILELGAWRRQAYLQMSGYA